MTCPEHGAALVLGRMCWCTPVRVAVARRLGLRFSPLCSLPPAAVRAVYTDPPDPDLAAADCALPE